jgi:epoxyqueuosine reductase
VRSPQEKERPEGNINDWLEGTFSELLSEAKENTLEDFPAAAIFDRPIMGVADGKDSLFEDFRRVVGPRHIRPADFLRRQSPALDGRTMVKVVSWALPFSSQILISNRGREWPSELYSVARNNGAALIYDILCKVVRILRSHGYAAAAPAQTDEYDAFRSPDFTFSSSWSERHVAYAAGLGRFGLNGCLMTPLGTNVRFASLVTSLPLEVRPEKRPDYRSPCLEDGGKTCGLCLERCPVQAISPSGLDKSKCYDRRQSIRRRFLEDYSQRFGLRTSPIVKNGRREPGFSLGCALCMSAVPCESRSFPEEKAPR